MIIGVSKVMCACGEEMVRTGGSFGDKKIVSNNTYMCRACEKYVLVLTLSREYQEEFAQETRKGV